MNKHGILLLASVSLLVSTSHAEDSPQARLGSLLTALKCESAEQLLADDPSARSGWTFWDERNLGSCFCDATRFTKGRFYLERALAHVPDPKKLPDEEWVKRAKDDEVRTRSELEICRANIVVYELQVRPAGTTLAVDERPLQQRAGASVLGSQSPASTSLTLTAGIHPKGPGVPVPDGRFILEIDPGPHQFRLSRRGFEDVNLDQFILKPSLVSGPVVPLPLTLDADKAATLRIDATRPGSVVRVDGTDVGIAPVMVQRPPGHYVVSVVRDGFETYQQPVHLLAGSEQSIHAHLGKEPLTKKPLFWALSGAGLIAAGVAGYFIAREISRPDPVRGPVNGGGLGWALRIE